MRQLLFFLLLLLSFASFAQEDKTQDSVAVVSPIEVTEINKQIESELQLIRQVSEELADQSIKEQADSLLPIFKEEYAALSQSIESSIFVRASPLELQQLERELKDSKERLQQLDDDIASRLDELNKAKSSVESHIETWRKTRDDNIRDQGFEAIRVSVYNVITQLVNLNANIELRLSAVLIVQQEVSSLSIMMQEDQEALQKALDASQKRLFTRNKGYLWQDFVNSQDSVGFASAVIHGLDIHWRSGQNIAKMYRSTFFYHAVIFILFIYSFWSLSRNQEKIEELLPDEHYSKHNVLEHPFAAAVIPPLVMTFWLYQEAPTIIYHVAFLLIIPPLFILVFRFMEGGLKLIIIFLIVTQLLESFYVNISNESEFFRILLLFNAVVILVTYYLFANRMRLQYQLDHKKRTYVFLMVARAAFIMAVFAIIANIVGYQSLSNYIIRGIVTTATLGLLVFTAGIIILNMITLYIYSPAGQRIQIIKEYSETTQIKISRTLTLILIFLWLELSLSLFESFFDFRQGVVDLWNFSFSFSGVEEETQGLTVGSIIVFLGVIYLSIQLSRLLRLIFDLEIQHRFQINADISSTVSILIRYSLITIGFVIAVAASGFSMDRLAILIGALGVGIGFGLQNIINNLISGLILAFERPVKVGDIIEVSSLSLIGTVKEIGIRASIIRTFDETEVIVPNGNIISNEVVNWTLSDKIRRNTIDIGVEYGTDPDEVIEILLKLVKTHPHIMDRPEPFALFTEFGDSSLNFKLYFWTANYDRRLQTISEIRVSINNALKEAGITIPFPQRDLHIKTVEDQASKALKEGPEPKAPPLKKKVPGGDTEKKN